MRRLFLLTALLTQFAVFADSPLTSTFFARAYQDQPLITEILQKRDNEMIYRYDLTAAHIAFFDRTDIGLDVKIALVNALGWAENGNVTLYINHLSKKYSISLADFELALTEPGVGESGVPETMIRLNYHDLVLLGYLQAMHDYFVPFKAIGVLDLAMLQNPDSEATAWVHALILSQHALDWDWCRVYTVVQNAILNPYSKDFIREAAKVEIMDYINMYESACDEIPTDTPPVDEEVVREEFAGWSEWTVEHFVQNPVYEKPATPQVSTKKEKVNLKIVNSEEPPYLQAWLDYVSEIDGTLMKVKVQNTGNTASIPTNLALVIFADEAASVPELHIQSTVPALKPNEERTLTIQLPGYWIYDPDANFKIILDYDDNIQESDEKDNERTYSERG